MSSLLWLIVVVLVVLWLLGGFVANIGPLVHLLIVVVVIVVVYNLVTGRRGER